MTSLKRFVDTAKKKQNREKTLIKLSGGQQRPTVLAVPAEEERDTNVCIAFQKLGWSAAREAARGERGGARPGGAERCAHGMTYRFRFPERKMVPGRLFGSTNV